MRIFEKEVVSGRKAERPVLSNLLDELRRGDELHVAKLDRLGRTTNELHDIARTLEERQVSLVIGGKTYDPTDPMGKIFFGLLALFAEFEADLIAERTRERLAVLKAQGKQVGKPKKLTERQEIAIFQAQRSGMTITALAERYKVARTTIRRALEREELKRRLKDDFDSRRDLRIMQAEERRVETDLVRADEDTLRSNE